MDINFKYTLARLVAFLLDIALISVLMCFILPSNGHAGNAVGGALATLAITPVYVLFDIPKYILSLDFFVIWIIYNVACETLFKTSIGKYLMKIEIQYPADGFVNIFISSLARNLLRIVPFNSFSYLSNKQPFNDRWSGVKVVSISSKNTKVNEESSHTALPISQIEIKPMKKIDIKRSLKFKINFSFETVLKLLVITLYIIVLFNKLPADRSYDNYRDVRHNELLLGMRYVSIIVFGILIYRSLIIREKTYTLIYLILLIVYQPFLIIDLRYFSATREILVSLGLLISMIDFPGKNKMINWFSIKKDDQISTN
nr:RDD family protein [uncultured Pedobacter sp.]